VLCVALILVHPAWETVPLHLIWVGLTFVYGYRTWRAGATVLVLLVVVAATGAGALVNALRGGQELEEVAEIPLLAAMFAAMAWHASRRLAALRRLEAVSDHNRQLLERQRRFVQDASHELRTPITIALGHAELILRSGRERQDAAVVVDELTRLRRLSDRLLLLATAEDQDFLHRVPVEVEVILVESLRRWAPIPRAWRLGAVVDSVVLADLDRLALAIDALLENAVNHTGEGQPIELSARRQGDMVVIAVADTGAGVAGEDVGRLFERFAKGSGGGAQGGQGLGLAIVRAIATAHGGQARARRREAGGMVFEILLPEARREWQPEVGELTTPPAPAPT
jgi:signal transduction histidine kinase